MSLEKAIEHGKEKRKNYNHYPDNWCNNHGGCHWCKSDRFHSQRKRRDSAATKLKEYYCSVG